tara:strand:+ start:1178 stop:1672 length:495 start_codon:yes stop_codon:yes gene_type:complete
MELIKISKEQIERAKKLYPFQELRGSITKGKGNLIGAVGEIIVFDLFTSKGYKVEFNSTYDYDLIIDELKVDVKSKGTNYKPVNSFNCSIPAAQKKQKCHYYFFTYITYDYKNCYLAGYKSKESFFKEAHFAKKGELDNNGSVKWTFKADCYNLLIQELDIFKH